MLRFIFFRLMQAVPVLFIVITATFFLLRVAPGGPFDSERKLPEHVEAQLRAHYNMDGPLHRQYFLYLKNLARGDFGPSFRYPTRGVNEIILTGLPTTMDLALRAFAFALLLGGGLGLLAALRRNTWGDYVPMSFAMFGICMPSFLLGPLLILLFGIWAGWLPISGWGLVPGDRLLPTITLGAAYAAYIARLTRGGMLEVLGRDFIRTAHAKGLPPWRVFLQHGLRGAVIPLVAFLGPALAGLMSGSFVVETLFQIPGVGRFYVQAAFNRDYTMVMGTTIMFAILIIGFNLLSDILIAWLDPRIRHRAQP